MVAAQRTNNDGQQARRWLQRRGGVEEVEGGRERRGVTATVCALYVLQSTVRRLIRSPNLIRPRAEFIRQFPFLSILRLTRPLLIAPPNRVYSGSEVTRKLGTVGCCRRLGQHASNAYAQSMDPYALEHCATSYQLSQMLTTMIIHRSARV